MARLDLRRAFDQLAGGVVASAWTAPVIAAVITMVAYFVHSKFWTANAIVAGTVGGGIAWLVVGAVVSPVVAAKERSSHTSWELAWGRACALARRAQRLKSDPNPKDVSEIECDVEAVRAMCPFGLQWATKVGYIALWHRVHHGEEALISAMEMDELWNVVEHATLRLADASGIAPSLEPALLDVARYMAENPSGRTRPPARLPSLRVLRAPAAASQLLGRTTPQISSDSDARGRLREITAAINTFRDDRWAGLVNIRSQLLAALVLTEAFAYGLLALAVTVGVGRREMTAAITYFLVGAVTGFVGQLLILRTTTQAVEDYGLSMARLLLIPAVAGLAGLGGVVLTDLLFNAPFTSLVQAASAGRAAGPLPPLTDVFDLDRNRGGVIMAIVFGYAPNLLVRRLDDLVNTYKSAISSTETSTK